MCKFNKLPLFSAILLSSIILLQGVTTAFAHQLPKSNFAFPTELDTSLDHGDSGIPEESGTKQCIYFGRYPQTRLDVGEEGYKLGDNCYAIEPIKWRILSNDANKLFLQSVNCLDSNKPYFYNGYSSSATVTGCSTYYIKYN
jgi:hypothetical protein